MRNKERLATFRNVVMRGFLRGAGKFGLLGCLCLISVLLSACNASYVTIVPSPVQIEPSATASTIPTVTTIPTMTPVPSPTAIPADPPGTIALDFIALLCNADWMNGAQHLKPCPPDNIDRSGGYATTASAFSEQFPNTPILLMVPTEGGLFLRYPSFQVGTSDRFHTILLCVKSAPCDVEFALEYYDAQNKYHEFTKWDTKTDDAPIHVDFDLSPLAGKSVQFVLTLRIFHSFESMQEDSGLWVAPHIYRPVQ